METSLVLPLTGAATDRTGDGVDMRSLFERWHVERGQTNPGMPMHVTLMSPFVDSRDFDEEVRRRAREVLASWEPFRCSLEEIRTFDGDPTRAWLVPQPEATFVEMTTAIMAAFPGLEPYGGAHDGIQPHVSVAKSAGADLQSVIDAVASDLPVTTQIDSYEIYVLTSGTWRSIGGGPIGVTSLRE